LTDVITDVFLSLLTQVWTSSLTAAKIEPDSVIRMSTSKSPHHKRHIEAHPAQNFTKTKIKRSEKSPENNRQINDQ